ncbi:MAG: hypothetical protein ABJA67_03355, partial [Chthonomonadales bacterium]
TWNPQKGLNVWVGTRLGPCVSIDGGKSWILKIRGIGTAGDTSTPHQILKVLFDPFDLTHLHAFGGERISPSADGEPSYGIVWESADSGESWKRISRLPLSEGSRRAIVAAEYIPGAPQTIVVAADHAGIYLSNNGGKNWSLSYKGIPHQAATGLAVNANRPGVVFASIAAEIRPGKTPASGDIFVSGNIGVSWKQLSPALTAIKMAKPDDVMSISCLAVSPSNPNHLFANKVDSTRSTLIYTRSFGEGWAQGFFQPVSTAYSPTFDTSAICFDPQNDLVAFVGGARSVLITKDGGKTWTDVSALNVNKSTQSWSGRGATGLTATNILNNPNDASALLITGRDTNSIWLSQDGGSSWLANPIDSPNSTISGSGIWTRENVVLIPLETQGKFRGVARSADGGSTWKVLSGPSAGLPISGTNATSRGFATLKDGSLLFVVGGMLSRSTDSGLMWSTLDFDPDGRTAHPNHALFVSAREGTNEYVIGTDKGLVSIDENEFVRLIPGSPTFLNKVQVDSGGRIFAHSGATNGGLWKFEEDKWSLVKSGKDMLDFAVDTKDSNRIAIAFRPTSTMELDTQQSIWLTDDGGINWRPESLGLPTTIVACLKISPDNGRLVVGTVGTGFWTMPWPRKKQ